MCHNQMYGVERKKNETDYIESFDVQNHDKYWHMINM